MTRSRQERLDGERGVPVELAGTLAKYGDDVDFTAGLRSARAGAGDRLDEVLTGTGALLLPPLCVATGRVRAAVDWLRSHGLEIHAAEQVRLTAETVRRIWKYQSAAPEPERVRIFIRLLTCGPAVVLGVRGSAAGGRALPAWLREQKGPADPYRAGPGHLRTHLGAANTFNNLAHSSDEPADVVREVYALLGATGSVAFWRAAASGSRVPRRQVLDLAPVSIHWGGISLAHVCVALRRSLVHALGASGVAVPTRLAHRLDAEYGWVDRRSPTTPLQTLAEFRARFRPLAPLLPAASPSGDQVDRIAVATAFGETEAALFRSRCDLDSWERAVDRCQLAVSTRDRLVVATEWLSDVLRERLAARAAAGEIGVASS
jgi:nucleoside diphosphate kinase